MIAGLPLSKVKSQRKGKKEIKRKELQPKIMILSRNSTIICALWNIFYSFLYFSPPQKNQQPKRWWFLDCLVLVHLNESKNCSENRFIDKIKILSSQMNKTEQTNFSVFWMCKQKS